MTFGMVYLLITAVVAAKWRSRAAFAALLPLAATVALWEYAVPNAGAYSSALWALSGLYLLRNSEYAAGALYGISGIVYIAYYFGAPHETFAVIPIISDIAFALGLVAGTWPNAFTYFGRSDRRVFRRSAVQIAREDLARDSTKARGEG